MSGVTAIVQRSQPAGIIALLLQKGNQSVEVAPDYLFPTGVCLHDSLCRLQTFLTTTPSSTVLYSVRRVLWKGTPAFLRCLHFSPGWILRLEKNPPETLRYEGNHRKSEIPLLLGVCMNLPKAVRLPGLLVLLPIPILKWSLITPTSQRLGWCCVGKHKLTEKLLGFCLLLCRHLQYARNTAMLVSWLSR